jgi:hypothetical protein
VVFTLEQLYFTNNKVCFSFLVVFLFFFVDLAGRAVYFVQDQNCLQNEGCVENFVKKMGFELQCMGMCSSKYKYMPWSPVRRIFLSLAGKYF